MQVRYARPVDSYYLGFGDKGKRMRNVVPSPQRSPRPCSAVRLDQGFGHIQPEPRAPNHIFGSRRTIERSKIFPQTLQRNPIPVSCTEMLDMAIQLLGHKWHSPRSRLYLTPLLARFTSTCLIRAASPTTVSGSPGRHFQPQCSAPVLAAGSAAVS